MPSPEGVETKCAVQEVRPQLPAKCAVQEVCPQLPTEIWERIANMLSHKDRLRGLDIVCKDFNYNLSWDAFPPIVSCRFGDSSHQTVSAVWDSIASRWPCATQGQLAIEVDASTSGMQMVSFWNSLRRAWRARPPQQLPCALLLRHGGGNTRNPGIREFYSMRMCLCAMAQLANLSLYGVSPVLLPQMVNLRKLHLELDDFPWDLLNSLKQAPGLLQLTLAFERAVTKHSCEVKMIGGLHLMDCTSLRQLNLSGISLTGEWYDRLELPPACVLRLELPAFAFTSRQDFCKFAQDSTVAHLFVHCDRRVLSRQCLPKSLGIIGTPFEITMRFFVTATSGSSKAESEGSLFSPEMHIEMIDLSAQLLRHCDCINIVVDRPLGGIRVPPWLQPRELSICRHVTCGLGELEIANPAAFVSRMQRLRIEFSVKGDADMGKVPAWCQQLADAARAAGASVLMIMNNVQ